jgi:hypothetical protein
MCEFGGEEERVYGSLDEVMVGDGDRLNRCGKVFLKEDSEGDGMCDDDGCVGWWKVVVVVGMGVVDFWLMNTAGLLSETKRVQGSLLGR